MDERKDVEAWADALLERHRSDPDPEPPLRWRWLTRDLPKTYAFLEAAEAIGMVILGLIALALIGVAFNSG